MRRGTATHFRLVKAFGTQVLLPSGEVDRERLGQRVFRDAAARRRLNAIVHPAIARVLAQRLLSHCLLSWGGGRVVLDAPLLFETPGLSTLCSPIVVVVCGPEEQVARLRARDDLGSADALARISAQMSMEKKATMADILVDNRGTLEELRSRAEQVAAQLREW